MVGGEDSKAYQLIHSMSKEEKRYFKLFAQGIGKKDSKHIQLFDILTKQKVYNKATAKRSLRNIKNFGATEHYLYQMLLKSLRVYTSSSSIEMEILDAFKNIRVLYNRQLYELAKETLVSIKKFAIQHDQLHYLPQLYEWEVRIEVVFYQFKDVSNEQFEQFKVEYINQLEMLRNFGTYSLAALEFTYLSQKLGYSQELEKRLSNIMGQPWMQDFNHCQSLSARLTLCEIHAIYYSFHEIEKSLDAYIRIIREIEEAGPEVQQQRHKQYIISIANAGSLAINLHKWEEAQRLINIANNLPEKQLTPRFRLFQYNLNLTLQVHKGAFDKAVELLPEGKQFVEDYAEKLPEFELLIWRYLAAIVHFGLGDYEKSIDYLEELQQYKTSKELQSAAKLLLLISLYEQEQFELLSSTLRSSYRFFKKNTDENSFEQMMVSCLKRLSNLPNNRMFRDQLKGVRAKLEGYYRETKTWHLYLPYSFDYLTWLDSKIGNVSLSKMLEQKFKAL
ncbi:MAG: hypothetical protein GY810_17080 [Aureispira sp.]|nr:hypothetical protein [Aureispira sp.]